MPCGCAKGLATQDLYIPSFIGWVFITLPAEAASSVCDELSDWSLVTENPSKQNNQPWCT